MRIDIHRVAGTSGMILLTDAIKLATKISQLGSSQHARYDAKKFIRELKFVDVDEENQKDV